MPESYEHVIDCSGTTAADILHTWDELAPLREAQAQAYAQRQEERHKAAAIARLRQRARTDATLADLLAAFGLDGEPGE